MRPVGSIVVLLWGVLCVAGQGPPESVQPVAVSPDAPVPGIVSTVPASDEGTLGGELRPIDPWFITWPWDELRGMAVFPASPYAEGGGGYLVPWEAEATGKTNCLSIRAFAEGGKTLSDIDRTRLRFAIDTASRWGVVSQWDYFRDDPGFPAQPDRVFGNVLSTYRLVQAEHWQMHAQVGVQGLLESDRARLGTLGGVSLDLFPRRPFVFSAEAQVGHLHDQWTSRVRGTAGVQFHHLQIYAGYDWFRFGDLNLHGPVVGVGLWY